MQTGILNVYMGNSSGQREDLSSCLNKQGCHETGMLILLLWILICPTLKVHAQISHGGWPLEQGAEQTSMLRSAVDYFVEMPYFNVDSVRAIDDLPGNRVGGLKFAHKFFVDLTPENSGLVFHTEDGTKVWKIGIRSSGAYSLNILFSDFTLPEGAQVFLYNSDRSTVLGSFTRENRPDGGEFSVSPVDGEELTIEYHEPANADFSGNLRISEVNHDYRGLLRLGTSFMPGLLPCIPDLSCNSDLETIGRSVCLLIINGVEYCTGVLINNTANDGKPYLLTASHCILNNMDIGSRVVAFLNYESPRCDKRIRGSEDFSVSGSKTKALSKEVDFALLELTEMPPIDYRPYLAGWSLDTETANALPFTSIHHPVGDVKKYCIEEDSVTFKDFVDPGDTTIHKGNHWNIKEWEIGHTWSGSSGAPLFDKNNRIRGGLTGGDSGGLGGCSYYESGDYFFRLDRAWDQFPEKSKQLKCWLDPITPDNVPSSTNLNGLDPYSDHPVRRISNLTPSDSLGKINLESPKWGSLFGHNSYGTTDFSEHFTTTDSSMIHGVYLVAAKGNNNSGKPVNVRVYEGGENPGAILAKAVLNPNYIEYSNGSFKKTYNNYLSNKENYIRFDKPVSVGTDFYVGYEIEYPITSVLDSFYLYAAIRKDAAVNTAYFKKLGYWYPYTEHSLKPVYTSLWIEPVISHDTISTVNTYNEVDKDSLINKQPIIDYSSAESAWLISLPDQWERTTFVEIFDLNGRKIIESKISPPLGKIKYPPARGKFFIVRLRNQGFVYVLKTIAE